MNTYTDAIATIQADSETPQKLTLRLVEEDGGWRVYADDEPLCEGYRYETEGAARDAIYAMYGNGWDLTYIE